MLFKPHFAPISTVLQQLKRQSDRALLTQFGRGAIVEWVGIRAIEKVNNFRKFQTPISNISYADVVQTHTPSLRSTAGWGLQTVKQEANRYLQETSMLESTGVSNVQCFYLHYHARRRVGREKKHAWTRNLFCSETLTSPQSLARQMMCTLLLTGLCRFGGLDLTPINGTPFAHLCTETLYIWTWKPDNSHQAARHSRRASSCLKPAARDSYSCSSCMTKSLSIAYILAVVN